MSATRPTTQAPLPHRPLLPLVGRVSDPPPTQPRRRCAHYGALAVILALAACSSAPPEDRAQTSDRLDPVLSVGPEPAPRDSRAATNPPRAAAPLSDSTAPRADGRPPWWLDEPQTRDGRVFLSAEALGDDVRSARRAAVDAALESLERSLSAPPTDERILAAVVAPLPRRADAPGAARFVGYVLISHPAPADPAAAAR